MTQIEPRYVTRKQVAARFSCSDQMVSKLIKTGRLPAFYVGRAVRIKESDLELALDQYNPAAPRGDARKKAALQLKQDNPSNRRVM